MTWFVMKILDVLAQYCSLSLGLEGEWNYLSIYSSFPNQDAHVLDVLKNLINCFGGKRLSAGLQKTDVGGRFSNHSDLTNKITRMILPNGRTR